MTIVERIAAETGCSEECVFRISELALEALHECAVKHEQGVGGLLTESAWMFSPAVCWHLNGILLEYSLETNSDEAYLITETMRRFMPSEWDRFQPQFERWLEERSEDRKALDGNRGVS